MGVLSTMKGVGRSPGSLDFAVQHRQDARHPIGKRKEISRDAAWERSVMAVAHVRKPADFVLPADPHQLSAALLTLPREDLERYASDLLEAMAQVKPVNDFRPLLLATERWYRYAVLRQQPGWDHALQQAEALRHGDHPHDIHALDFDQVRKEVDRRRRARSA